MYAICGWAGERADDQGSERLLAGMLRGCGVSDPQVGGRALAPRAGVGATAGPGLVHGDRDLLVALSEPVAGPDGTRLDAGAVAALYRERGESLPELIHGSFALAVLDFARGTTLLAVDRAGIRPLYLARIGDSIAFSSRLAALSSIPGIAPRLSDQALFDYLYFHVIPSPGTVWTGVEKLLPAQSLVLGRSGNRARFYWEMPYRDDNRAGLDTLKGEFRALLPQAVGDAARVPGPGAGSVGCFLSGGTDSSTVAGTLKGLGGAPVPTYSMGFEAEGFDEVDYARIAARHFRVDAREYYVKPQEVVDAIPLLAEYTDEPFANASIVPAYLCARFARADGTLRLLAGDGGDEIFGGNARYANQQVFELYGKVPGWMRAALVDPVAALPGLGSVPGLKKLKSYVDQARVPLPDRLETYNFLHRTPLAEIFEPDFLSRVDPQAPLAGNRECYGRARSGSIVNRMMHLDLKITLADNDLRKVSQACELAGVDVRFPLLDERLMAFAASVPPGLQLKDNRLRWFFKQALADFLPPEILAKKKHGFGLPVGLWMAEYAPLRELTESSVAALRQRGIVRPAYIDWVRESHAGQHAGYYGVMLWVLVMLEQWLARHGR
jgi:asparagine synthase (glutamine-hydrolysing)